MSAANKRKGTTFEVSVEDYGNENGLHARRLPRSGSKDIGDVAIVGVDFDIVVECKNVKNVWGKMKEFLRQASLEASWYELKFGKPTIGVVATKTRQAGTGEARMTLTYDQFINLIRWGGIG